MAQTTRQPAGPTTARRGALDGLTAGAEGHLGSHPLARLMSTTSPPARSRPRLVAPQQIVGGALVLAGVVTMMFGWWGMSGTKDLLHQFSYLMSGGVMGAALVATGLAVVLGHEHARDRAEMRAIVERLDSIEHQVASLARRRREPAAQTNGASTPGAGRPAEPRRRRAVGLGKG